MSKRKKELILLDLYISSYLFDIANSADSNFAMEVTGNGNLVIPPQYLFTTDYQGDAYDYVIEGTGFWTN